MTKNDYAEKIIGLLKQSDTARANNNVEEVKKIGDEISDLAAKMCQELTMEEFIDVQLSVERYYNSKMAEEANGLSNKEIMDDYVANGTKYLEPVQVLMALNDKPENLMDDADYEFYRSLPDNVTIYRGLSKDELEDEDGDECGVQGISWTTEYSVAEFFAARIPQNLNPCVVKAVVPKSNIRFATMRRCEFEVLVLGVADFEIVQDNFDGFDFEKFHEDIKEKAKAINMLSEDLVLS